MELFLNLVWFTLALPAFVLWRRARISAKQSGQICRTNTLVLVGCLLLLLFPVISASDDLLALGLEMEESGATNCLVKQSVPTKAHIPGDGVGAPAHLPKTTPFAPDDELLTCSPISEQVRV